MVREQVWSIGIYGGRSPLQLTPLAGVQNPVLTGTDVTDIAGDFVADLLCLDPPAQLAGRLTYYWYHGDVQITKDGDAGCLLPGQPVAARSHE